MHALIISTFAVLASFCAAGPVSPLEAREKTSNVHAFSGDNCNGAVTSVSVTGSGANRCFAVSGKRSISVGGR